MKKIFEFFLFALFVASSLCVMMVVIAAILMFI